MKLSTKGRYAVMAMVDLADSAADRPVPLADIASRQAISLSYLEQLFAKLRRADIVHAVRGPGGGYQLARPAADTRVADIMLAVEEPVDVTRCRNGAKGCMENGRRCATHDLWDELGRHIHLFLSSVSLEDVIERRVLGKATRRAAPKSLEAAE
ncbi:Rrf2 family transcriptional regulator [Marinicauda salina]|uniref:Rrf2 family transcriptional regulator n=1 Tax=Marinicauda salina TaxID=2135793 RepID=A0A2U2BTI3_9PROT|nr:Rrf2 family transcriptional regulator [Marinicauda salina]PWE17298.1 Rrf2 family transcriptional regulator [Marinicauda salina]